MRDPNPDRPRAQCATPWRATTGLSLNYERRAEQLKRALAELEAQSDALSRQRGLIMLGVLGGALAIWLAKAPSWAWAVPGALVLVFIALVVRHAGVASRKTLLEERQRYVQAGMRRLAGEPEPHDPFRSKPKDPDGSHIYGVHKALLAEDQARELAFYVSSYRASQTIDLRHSCLTELID